MTNPAYQQSAPDDDGAQGKRSAPDFGVSPLRLALHRALRESPASAEEISWKLRIAPNRLYRACMPSASGLSFPIDWLPVFSTLTRSAAPLVELCRECEHLAVPVAKIRRFRKNPQEEANIVSADFHGVMVDVHKFAANPSPEAAVELNCRLRMVMAEIEAIRRGIEKFAQTEL
jgi:hypothetical protein